MKGMELEDLLQIVVATGKPQRTEETPSIVSAIDYREIRRSGYRTVGEALRRIPGLAVVDDHVDFNVGVRGTYAALGAASDILKVMINGYPILFRPNSGNAFGFDLIPIQAVKRIEVIRGPASALYGANAFLGIINIITFEGDAFHPDGPMGPNGTAALEGAGVFNPQATGLNGSAAVVGGGTMGPVKIMLSGAVDRSNRSGMVAPGSEDLLSTTPKGYPSPGWSRGARLALLDNNTTERDTAVESSIYGLGTLDLGQWGRASVDVNWRIRDKSAEFLTDSTLTHRSRISTHALFTRLRFDGTPKDEGFSWKASATFFKGSPLPDDRVVDDTALDVRARREFGSTGVTLMGQGSYSLAANRVFTLGADLEVDHEDLLTLVNVNSEGVETRANGYGNRTFTNVGVFAQGLWSIIEGLNVVAGARLDTNNVIACNTPDWNCFGRQSSAVSPLTGAGETQVNSGGRFQMSNRLAVVYAPVTSDFYAKAAWGTSYKPPSPYQLYHTQSAYKGTVGNPFLKPQTADTIEGQVGYQFTEGLTAFLAVFRTNIKNIVGALKGVVALEGRNFDSQISGLEAGVDWKWKDRLELGLNASYLFSARLTPLQRADETDAEWARFPFQSAMPIGQYPDLLGSLYASYRRPDWHLVFTANVNYIGSRNASLIHKQLYASREPDRTYSFRPYALLRLNVSTTGLYLLSAQRETVFSAMYFGTPGTQEAESGFSGTDIPVQGPTVYLRVTQMF